MTLHFLNDVNDVASFDIKFTRLGFEESMLNRNREAEPHNSTSVLEALPGKLDIK